MNLNNIKETAICQSLAYNVRAILLPNHHTKVGASIYTKNGVCYGGFNIQNFSHKSYHAEELAVLNCYLNNVKPEDVVGIIITYSANDLSKLTFACGHCRQILWEYTKNSNFLITEVSMEGKILSEKKLGELYPIPYPYFKYGEAISNTRRIN